MVDQQHTDSVQIIMALKKQNELLEKIAEATEKTASIIFSTLSEDQKKVVHAAAVARSAKKLCKPRQP